MCHLSALLYTHDDILAEANHPSPYGDESPQNNSFEAKRGSADNSDTSFEIDLALKESSMLGGFASDGDLLVDQKQLFGSRPRLQVF